MKPIKYLLVIILALLTSSCASTDFNQPADKFAPGINVIPQPRQIITKPEHCVLTEEFIILLESTQYGILYIGMLKYLEAIVLLISFGTIHISDLLYK